MVVQGEFQFDVLDLNIPHKEQKEFTANSLNFTFIYCLMNIILQYL